MKKLTFNEFVVLERRPALCNFCGQYHDNCIKGTLELENYIPKTVTRYVVKDFDCDTTFTGKMIYKCKNRPELGKAVVDGEYDKEKSGADICPDCVRQLYKLIKSK